MKKNLAVSICMLLLAVLTFGAVSFAYFSDSGSGGDNYLMLGEFAFEAESSLTESTAAQLKNSTVLNPEKIVDDPSNPDAHALWLSDGDDELFDYFCLPLTLTVTNKSRSDMRISVALQASSGALQPAYDKAVTYFILNDTGLSDAQKAQSAAERIRAASAEHLQESGLEPSDPLYVCDKALKTFAAANAAANDSLLLSRVTGTADAPVFDSCRLKLIVWLDYRVFSPLAAGLQPGSITLSVTVTATNNVEGAA